MVLDHQKWRNQRVRWQWPRGRNNKTGAVERHSQSVGICGSSWVVLLRVGRLNWIPSRPNRAMPMPAPVLIWHSRGPTDFRPWTECVPGRSVRLRERPEEPRIAMESREGCCANLWHLISVRRDMRLMKGKNEPIPPLYIHSSPHYAPRSRSLPLCMKGQVPRGTFRNDYITYQFVDCRCPPLSAILLPACQPACSRYR